MSVTSVGESRYLVRAERIAPGVPLAEEQVSWPVEDWLVQAHQLMNDPLLGLLQGNVGLSGLDVVQGPLRSHQKALNKTALATDPSPASAMFNLVTLGQQLYNNLFQGTIRDSWMTAQGIAQHRREVLRLRLGLKDKRLLRLPWEVLHAGDRPIATGTDVIFSRYQFGLSVASPTTALGDLIVKPGQPLRILMAIAAPSDQDGLNLKREVQNLKEELLAKDNASPLPEIQLTILEQPDREQLTQALEQGQYQVLHYAGHSNLGASGGDLYLVSGRTGLTETFSGDDLAGLLVNNGIRLAIFNSCRGAYTAAIDDIDRPDDRNLADALIRRGVPAVLAMAEHIPDEVALTLTRLFYRNLKQGYPIDLSVSRTRQGLVSAYGSNNLYWALPILYLSPEFDGTLLVGEGDRSTTALEPRAAVSLVSPSVDPLEIWPNGVPPEMLAADAGLESLLDAATTPTNGNNLLGSTSNPPIKSSNQEELAALVDDLEYDQPIDYGQLEENMSKLLNQLTYQANSGSPEELMLPATNENLLPEKDDRDNGLDRRLPQQSRYQPSVDAGFSQRNGTSPSNESSPTLPDQNFEISDRRSSAESGFDRPDSRDTHLHQETRQRFFNNKLTIYLLFLLGGMVVGTALFMGFRKVWTPNSGSLPNVEISPPTRSPVFDPNTANLSSLEHKTLVAIATESFGKNDLKGGNKAVTELLDRIALKEAETALSFVTPKQLKDSGILFLKGRLAWQAVQQQEEEQQPDRKFSLSDAQLFWFTAVKQDKTTVLYRNALGFAYYKLDKLSEAEKEFLEARQYLEGKPDRDQPASVPNSGLATTYAGLALVKAKAAEQQSPSQQSALKDEAKRYQQLAISQNPADFTEQALGVNWLWTEDAIVDWFKLTRSPSP